uniref:4 kDa protein n=1 Tax=Grapevine leafroll-associated virus 3 TaxID=55951 RepID=E2CV58_9CLOS|nr:4 kDa protein [Grapevine leafroll-associated virus 3]
MLCCSTSLEHSNALQLALLVCACLLAVTIALCCGRR